MKIYGRVKLQFQAILTSRLYGSEWLYLHTAHFILKENDPSANLIGQWLRPIASLNPTKERKSLVPAQNWPQVPRFQSVTAVSVLSILHGALISNKMTKQ